MKIYKYEEEEKRNNNKLIDGQRVYDVDDRMWIVL